MLGRGALNDSRSPSFGNSGGRAKDRTLANEGTASFCPKLWVVMMSLLNLRHQVDPTVVAHSGGWDTMPQTRWFVTTEVPSSQFWRLPGAVSVRALVLVVPLSPPMGTAQRASLRSHV